MWVPAEGEMGDGFLAAAVADSCELADMSAGSPIQVPWRNNPLKAQPSLLFPLYPCP